MAAEMSRESRAMLLNVLWHHQGGSSPVGQPLRKLLGIGRFDCLTLEQVREAKWIDRLLADAVRKTPDGVPAVDSVPVPPSPAPVVQQDSSYPAQPEGQEVTARGVARWHSLKTDTDVFDAVADGRKTFEIRLNDRDFRVGDGLHLRKTRDTGWAMKNTGAPLVYTGDVCERIVTHVLRGPQYGLAEGWVILSIAAINEALQEPT